VRVGGGPGVAQDAGDGGGRRRHAVVGRVGRRRGDADDGGGEVRVPAVQLQVAHRGVQAGAAEQRNTENASFQTRNQYQPLKGRLCFVSQGDVVQ